MFRKAGYPDAAEGLSPSLIDDLIIHGREARVAEELARRAAEGFGEVMALPLIAGDDREGSIRRSIAAVARAATVAPAPQSRDA